MTIDRDEPGKYNLEYGVQLRRLTELMSLTSPIKEAMGGGISVVAPGETVTEHVNKPNVEEIFLLLDGEARFTLEGAPQVMKAGDVGFAAIGKRHEFTNTSSETIRLLSVWWRAVDKENLPA